MANKELDLFKELMPSIDLGFKELYDAASDVGRTDIKKDLWILNRWVSSIGGTADEQEVMVVKVNEIYNKNWNILGGTNHNKLQWQLLCVAGNTGKKQKHTWIGLNKKKDTNSKAVNLLLELYPNKKEDEVELLARISTKEEIRELAREFGYDKVDI
jgi:hypothetical protein